MHDPLLHEIAPKMLIAGFFFFSIASVILAGILAPIVISIAG